MPYIKHEFRERMRGFKEAVEVYGPTNAGELNYAFTLIIKDYMATEQSYQRYNDVIGALEGAKLELYRRKIAPYEDLKIKANGDAY